VGSVTVSRVSVADSATVWGVLTVPDTNVMSFKTRPRVPPEYVITCCVLLKSAFSVAVKFALFPFRFTVVANVGFGCDVIVYVSGLPPVGLGVEKLNTKLKVVNGAVLGRLCVQLFPVQVRSMPKEPS